MKDSNPAGEFAFSDPVSWHSLPVDPHTTNPSPPPTRLPSLQCTQGISAGRVCTFHNRLIRLNITPAESWVTPSVDPLLPLFPPFFLPLSSTFNSNPLLTLLSLIRVFPRSPNCLSWPPPHFREIPTAIGMPWSWSLTKECMCVLRTQGEQFDWIFPIQEHAQISWTEWDLRRRSAAQTQTFYFLFFCYTFPQTGTRISSSIHFHEMSFPIWH